MYQTRIIGNGLYHAVSQGYGAPIETFGTTEEGETPMSLVTIALASCVTMCVQGYFAKHHQKKDLKIDLDTTYQDQKFDITMKIDATLTDDIISDIKTYINDHCRVKGLLREDISFFITVL